jgi:hypothetical protein
VSHDEVGAPARRDGVDVVFDVCSTGDISLSNHLLVLEMELQLHVCVDEVAGYSKFELLT